MPGPPPATTSLQIPLTTAVSAAARDAAARHALRQGQPYATQLLQPFPSPRSRVSGAAPPNPPPPPAPESPPSDAASSPCPGSPWTSPLSNPEPLDLTLGQPPGECWEQSKDDPNGPEAGSGTADDDDGGGGSGGDDANGDGDADAGGSAGDDGEEEDADGDNGWEAGADADGAGEGEAEGEGGEGGSGVDPGSRNVTVDGVADANASDAGAGIGAADRRRSTAGGGGGVAAGTGAEADAADDGAGGGGGGRHESITGAPAAAAHARAAGDCSSAFGVPSGFAAAAAMPYLGAVSGAVGVATSYSGSSGGNAIRTALLPQLPAGGGGGGGGGGAAAAATRVPRSSGMGSRDSSPPSTSGSMSGGTFRPVPGALGATTSSAGAAPGFAGAGGGGSRRTLAPVSELAALGGARRGPLQLSASGFGLGPSSGLPLGPQDSFASAERAAAAKIYIDVCSEEQGFDLNIQGRGHGGGGGGGAPPGEQPRRGRSTATGFAGAAGKAGSSASLAGGGTAATTSKLTSSSALWSSARRLQMSLQRLHQQYQNYHTLQGGPELAAPAQLALTLQTQRSQRGGGGGGGQSQLQAEASSSSMSARQQRVAGLRGREAGSSGAGAGGGAGPVSPRAPPRRRAVQRSLSAPSIRPPPPPPPHSPHSLHQPLGMSVGLRMEPDTQLQLDAVTSRGLVTASPPLAVHVVPSLLELGEGRWSQLLHPDAGGGDASPSRSLRTAKSLPMSPLGLLAKGRAGSSPRSAARGGGDGAAAAAAAAGLTAATSSPRVGDGSSQTAMTSPRHGAVAAAAAAAVKSPSCRPRGRRASATHPVLMVPCMVAAAAATAAEDPDLMQVVEKARRRAALEKQKRRAAREMAAASAGGVSVRRRAGHTAAAAPPPPALAAARTAADKAKATELLFQRQAEDWARTHRQLPPRRRLAPSVTKMVEKWFSLVDDDGSGHLETKELATALQAAGVPCSEGDVLELVSTIDVNRDGAVSLSEFLSFLLKELGAGKNLTTGEYVLPSGGQLPFAAMIARLKRLRVLDDVMRGGKARNRYVDMLYNRDALAAEIGLSEKVAAGLQAIPVALDAGRGAEDPQQMPEPTSSSGAAPAASGVRRGGRVRLQQLFQQYRQEQRRATFEGMSSGPEEPAPASDPRFESDSGQELGHGGVSFAGFRGGGGGGDDGGDGWAQTPDLDVAAAAGGGGGGGGGEVDSDYDAVLAGFGEKVSGVSYFPRHSSDVSMLQSACLSQRPSGDGVVLLPGGDGVTSSHPQSSLFFQLTEVLLPLEESYTTSGADGGGGGGGADGEADLSVEASCFSVAAAPAAAAAAAPRQRLLPVISPLPPVKRPNTRAFQRALVDVRQSAPEYLLQRLGLPGPLVAAAAAAALAGPNPTRVERNHLTSQQPPPRGRRRTGGGSGAAAATGGGGAAASSFRPLASTAPAGLPGVERPTSSASTSTSTSTASLDPLTSGVSAGRTAVAAAGAYYTMYGAGFTRYKRWSMYDIDPAAENPDYWQAKAAALLMHRTSCAVSRVPGAGVATLSPAAAAAAAAVAVADAARDIELCPALPATATATAAAAVVVDSGSGKHLLPSPSSAYRRLTHPPQSPSQYPNLDVAAVGWHLPSLPAGTAAAAAASGGGGAIVRQHGVAAGAASPAVGSVGRFPPGATASSAGVMSIASVATSPRRWADDAAAAAAALTSPSPSSPTRQHGRGSHASRGFGAAALSGRGSVAAALPTPPGAAGGCGAGGAVPSSPSCCGSPAVQYVIRPQHGAPHGAAANPRLAADALRRRRPVPLPAMDAQVQMQIQMQMAMKRSLSRSPSRYQQRLPSKSPQRSRSLQPSPQRSPQPYSPQEPCSPQAQPRPPQRRQPSLPYVAGPHMHSH